MSNLPRYRQRKIVYAGQISFIDRKEFEDHATWHVWFQNTGAVVDVDDAFMARWAPDPGGYLIRYENGDLAYMPQSQFESMYEEYEE